MGRLELAGINPRRTPPARFWRALWALFVEYKTTFDEELDAHVRSMWHQLAGTAAQAPTATAPPRPDTAPASVVTSSAPPTRPGERREGRPTREDMEAWALASAAAGTNVIGAMPRGQSGAAERVGG